MTIHSVLLYASNIWRPTQDYFFLYMYGLEKVHVPHTSHNELNRNYTELRSSTMHMPKLSELLEHYIIELPELKQQVIGISSCR